MKEILTLQFGCYANHVGAHFWNLQNELLSPAYGTAAGDAEADHAALLHEAPSGDVHPRAVVYDVRDSVGLARAGAASRGQGGGGGGGGGGGDGGGLDASRAAPGAPPSWGDYLQPALLARSLVPLGGRSATGDAYGSAAADGLSDATAAFDAYPLGRAAFGESLFEPVRRWLEDCDGLQGVQAVVDVDSGWGGLAECVLAAARDELPRAALLVLGAAPPPGSARAPATRDAPAPGDFDFRGRARAAVRALNLGLATAAFGGADNDLDAVFLPLGAGARGLAAAWGPRGGALPPHAAAALLGAAWDSATLPARRAHGAGGVGGGDAEGDGGGVLECAVAGGGGAAAGGIQRGGGAGGDSRVRRRGDGAGRRADDHWDDAIERPAAHAVVALPASLTLGQLLAAVAPSPDTRVVAVAAALPFPHPRATATELAATLAAAPPPHVWARDGAAAGGGKSGSDASPWGADGAHAPLMTSLSDWYSWGAGSAAAADGRDDGADRDGDGDDGDNGGYGGGGGDAATPSQHVGTMPTGGGGRAWGADGVHTRGGDESSAATRSTPFAHVVVVRGVGTHATVVVGGGGGGNSDASSLQAAGGGGGGRAYASTARAYGAVVETWLARSRCPRGAHAVLRTPIALPASFPRPWPRRCLDAAGGLVVRRGGGGVQGGAAGGDGDKRGGGDNDDDDGGDVGAPDADGGVALPFSVPAVVSLGAGPALWPALRRVARDFARRDRSVLHRFAEDGGGGLAMEDAAAVGAVLDALADTYAGSDAARRAPAGRW